MSKSKVQIKDEDHFFDIWISAFVASHAYGFLTYFHQRFVSRVAAGPVHYLVPLLRRRFLLT
jgi:hypothetical protein